MNTNNTYNTHNAHNAHNAHNIHHDINQTSVASLVASEASNDYHYPQHYAQHTNTINNTFYINIDELYPYYNVYKNEIDNNSDYYIDFIKRDPLLYSDYLKICDIVQNIINNSNHSNHSNHHVGGDTGLIIGIVIGATLLSSCIAFLLWMTFGKKSKNINRYKNEDIESSNIDTNVDIYSNKTSDVDMTIKSRTKSRSRSRSRNRNCNDEYPLHSREKAPNIAEILSTILPKSWTQDITNTLNKGIDTNKNIQIFINTTEERLKKLSNTFSPFIIKKDDSYAKELIKAKLNVISTVVTSGVGNVFVNMPYFIGSAVNMTHSLFEQLKNITTEINNITEQNIKILNELHTTNKDIKKLYDEAIDDANNQLFFIYDLFSVNLSKGPQHLECWVYFIMDTYISSNTSKRSIYSLICIMNNIYKAINKEVINFLGTALDTLFPSMAGMGSIVLKLLEGSSDKLYTFIKTNLTRKYYKEIPRQAREIIEQPHLMKTYLYAKLNAHTMGISEYIIPDAVKKYGNIGIDLIAESIHKGLSLVFMFLNVFIIFSKYNKNNASFLALCDECKNFNLTHEMQTESELTKQCYKCRSLFEDSTRQTKRASSKELYNRCIKYKKLKYEQNKQKYLQLKNIE
jgi:hypothetical protein